jgi:parallel beta-helix repeat protein
MKFEKQVSLKWAIALVLIACLVSSSIVYYVFGVSPSSAFTISSGVYPGAPCYTVWREGDYYFAKDANGEIDYSGTNASYVINSALNALTVGRTWKEKVVIIGSITLTHDIVMNDYTCLEVLGKLTLADHINRPVIRNKPTARPPSGVMLSYSLEVCGSGVIDGNRANQDTHLTDYGFGVSGIDFENATDVMIHGITIQNCRCDGISLNYGQRIQVYGVTATGNYYDGIFCYMETHNATITNNICIGNGRAGIDVNGRADLGMKASQIVISNNVCNDQQGNLTVSGGIICEDARDLIISNNVICNNNRPGSESEETGFGIDLSFCVSCVVSNNYIYQNKGSGIRLYSYWGASDYNNIVGNIISGGNRTTLYGIWLEEANHTQISGNKIWGCKYEGIRLYSSWFTLISSNSLSSNGLVASGSSGIYLTGNSCNNTISSNKIYDSDDYELKIGSGSNYNMVVGNEFSQTAPGTHTGSLLNSGTGNIIKHNVGFVTERSGTAEASNGDTISFGVTFAGAPQCVVITVNENDARYIAQAYSITTTGFTLYLWDDTAVMLETVDKTISWYAEYTP